jgi:cysteinyl-tRNA synthetase
MVYNSLSHELEPLWRSEAASSGLSWYSCGPTVYDDAHLGHARAFVGLDAMRRVVEGAFGVVVRLVIGVTDVDDKIVSRVREAGGPVTAEGLQGFVRSMEQRFWEDMAWLGIRPPHAMVRVTDHVGDILEFVAVLRDAGLAYRVEGGGESGGGGWFFDTRAFEARGGSYGKLRAFAAEPQEPVSGKRDARDFALWKERGPTATGASGEDVAWDGGGTGLGWGRPGWHIECSAMSKAALGMQLDVHSGGVDLAFPHHTNEIAQSEAHKMCGSGGGGAAEPWVRVFVHTGHLHIEGRKMSKSLKNFITVRDLRAQSKTTATTSSSETPVAEAFRVYCLQHPYRATLNFSFEQLDAAGRWLDRVRLTVYDADAAARRWWQAGAGRAAPGAADRVAMDLSKTQASTRATVLAAFQSDFDFPAALDALASLAAATRAAVERGSTQSDACAVHNAALQIVETLHLLGVSCSVPLPSPPWAPAVSPATSASPPDAAVETLLQLRAALRSAGRELARSKDPAADARRVGQALLHTSDVLRDATFPSLGVPKARLRDTSDTPPLDAALAALRARS